MRPHLLWAGIAEALGTVGVLTVVAVYVVRGLAYPTPDTMRSIAAAGVAILLGYVVEAVWMVNRAQRKSWHENWLGNVCGAGLAGLLGIAAALSVAAHRESGGGGLLDDLGLWWSVSAIGLLGMLVTLHPFVADRWIRKGL